MIFNINKSELLNALTIVSKGISSHSTLPVLSGIYIEASKDGLVMQATDRERSIRYDVAALVEETGEVVISGKLLLDIVKNLPDAAVEFRSQDDSMSISCDASTFTLRTLNPENFPKFSQVDIDNHITISFSEFCAMVNRVAKMVSKDKNQPVLTGVLISTDDSYISMLALDGHRLAITKAQISGVEDGFEVLVSGSFLQEIASLPLLEENIEIGISDNQVVFSCQNMVFINRRIEGSISRYKKLIPDSYTTKTYFNTSELAAAIRRVGLMGDSSSSVKFDINVDTQDALLNSITQDVGSASETISCEASGENIVIAFNYRYLLEALMLISTPRVALETQSSRNAGILRAEGDEDSLYLIMPLRIF